MKIKNILISIFLTLTAAAVFAQTVPLTDEFYAPKRNNKFPKAKSGRLVLMGDFHTQTDQSHGGLTPEDRMLDAYYWGLDVIAITDHGNICGAAADTPVDSKWVPEDEYSVTWMINHVHKKMTTNPTIDAYKRALPMAKKYDVILLSGVETGISGKEHIVAVNIPLNFKCSAYDHWLSEDPGGKGIYYRDRFKEVCSAGGFMIYVHPHYGYAREQVQWGVDNGYIKGIEVMNGSDRNTEAYNKTWGATWGEAGWRWYGSFDYALKNNIGIYANTDSHEERGGTCTLVLAKERTAESVLEACRELRTVGYFDDMLWGRTRDVDDIISTCVEVTKLDDVDPKAQIVRISNKSPMKMTISVLDRDIEIPPYDNVLVRNETGRKSFVITYKNVWTSSTTRLKKRY